MKAVVFGGAGFLGSYVADELSNRGFEVVIFDMNSSPYLRKDQKIVNGNIMDFDQVKEVVKGAKYVYNFAGLADLNKSLTRPQQTLELNVLGNLNILKACASEGVERFIYASTVYVFSQHGSFYGISKRTSEQVIEEFSKEYGLDFTIVRYGSVFGDRSDKQNRIYRIVKQAILEKKITFKGNGEEEREYIHGMDAARLSVDILEDPQSKNQRFILTGVERFNYKQLLKMIKEMLGGDIDIEFLDEDYKGHYTYTPYSYVPPTGKKLVANPFVDFGQGLLHTIESIDRELEDQKPKS